MIKIPTPKFHEGEKKPKKLIPFATKKSGMNTFMMCGY